MHAHVPVHHSQAILGGTNVLLCSKGSIKQSAPAAGGLKPCREDPVGCNGGNERSRCGCGMAIGPVVLGVNLLLTSRGPADAARCSACSGEYAVGRCMHEEGVGQACVHACLSHNGHPLELLPHTTRSGTLAMHRQYMQPASLGEAPCLGLWAGGEGEQVCNGDVPAAGLLHTCCCSWPWGAGKAATLR